jgi:crotonobetainyl-CoA:carnitine CoA-transferase CaiB-like acyl-CoA transferase
VPAGPINRIDEAFDWADAQGLSPIVQFEGTPVRGVSSPIRLAGAKIGTELPPPQLDEHGDSIRTWLGGLGPEDAP